MYHDALSSSNSVSCHIWGEAAFRVVGQLQPPAQMQNRTRAMLVLLENVPGRLSWP